MLLRSLVETATCFLARTRCPPHLLPIADFVIGTSLLSWKDGKVVATKP